MGCHALLQGVFPTQGSNPGLSHCRWFLCQLSYQESPPPLTAGTKRTPSHALLAYPWPGLRSWARKQRMGSRMWVEGLSSPSSPCSPWQSRGRRRKRRTTPHLVSVRLPAGRAGPRDISSGDRRWGGREVGGLAWAPANVGEERESGCDSGEANKQSG